MIKAITLPETIEEKVEKYKKIYKLSEELVNSLLKSDYFFDFEEIVEKTKAEPKIVANTLASVLKDLKRRGVAVENLTKEKLMEVFSLIKQGKLLKENLPDVLKHLCENPELSVEESLKQLKIKLLSEEELEEIIKGALKETKEFKRVMAIVMSQVRGKADPKKTLAIIKKLISSKSS